MRFARTALCNFRNFAGPVEFSWGDGINVIVGPNGSGKTNLLESLNILSGWGPFSRRVSGVISWTSQSQEVLRARLYASVTSSGDVCDSREGSHESVTNSGDVCDNREGSHESMTSSGYVYDSREGSHESVTNSGDVCDSREGSHERVTSSGYVCDSREGSHEIEARISSMTVLRVDGKRETSTNLRLIMPSVTFLPTDTGLIDGGPSVRRAFIDRLCALCIPVYARRLADFRKISSRRSSMLMHISGGLSGGPNANAIDLVFARLGGWIMEARHATVARLSGLGGKSLPFTFELVPKLELGSGGYGGENFIRSEMRRMFKRERAAGRVLVGPGRMDLEIKVSGRPASEALSRGQKRRVVLALVLTAARLTEGIIKRSPVLLLDDLAAELDDAGRRAACEALRATGWQVILTGVEDPFPEFRQKVTHRLGN